MSPPLERPAARWRSLGAEQQVRAAEIPRQGQSTAPLSSRLGEQNRAAAPGCHLLGRRCRGEALGSSRGLFVAFVISTRAPIDLSGGSVEQVVVGPDGPDGPERQPVGPRRVGPARAARPPKFTGPAGSSSHLSGRPRPVRAPPVRPTENSSASAEQVAALYLAPLGQIRAAARRQEERARDRAGPAPVAIGHHLQRPARGSTGPVVQLVGRPSPWLSLLSLL